MSVRPRGGSRRTSGRRRLGAVAACALALGAGGAQALADDGTPAPPPATTAPAPPPTTPAPPPAASGAVVAERAVAVPQPVAAVARPSAGADVRPTRRPPARASARDLAEATPAARAAASQSVRIVDFAFGPASVTVNVGDTVTWTNEDSAPHTATADDGSFDTGTLGRGQRGSHTFPAAGTVTYYCNVHPSMTGTVVVAGAATAAPDATAAPAAPVPASPAAPAATDTDSALPDTGADVLTVALAGVALLAIGLPLRRRTRPR